MADDGTKITLRVGPEEIQLMEDFMSENGIGNRSDFIRDAIRGYVEFKRTATQASGVPTEGGIFVRFNDLQMQALKNLTQLGICLTEEEFVRKSVLDVLISEDKKAEAIRNAFAAAQMSADLK